MDRIKDFFLPKFSEADASILSFSLLMPLVEYRGDPGYILNLLKEINDESQGKGVIAAVFLLYWFFIVFKSIISKNRLSYSQIKHLAQYFYVMISFLSASYAVGVLLSVHDSSNINFMNKLNTIFITYLFIKSLISLVVSSSKSMVDVLATRFKDYQMGISEAVVYLLLVIFFYFWFRPEQSLAGAIILTYFYTTALSSIVIFILNRKNFGFLRN